MLYNELMQGTKIFHVADDGTEEVEYKAPTSKELRAARAIKDLSTQVEQFSTMATELTQRYQALLAEWEVLNNKVKELEAKLNSSQEIQS